MKIPPEARPLRGWPWAALRGRFFVAGSPAGNSAYLCSAHALDQVDSTVLDNRELSVLQDTGRDPPSIFVLFCFVSLEILQIPRICHLQVWVITEMGKEHCNQGNPHEL